jgi:hypothetical protein
MADAKQTIVLIGHDPEVSWEANLIVSASRDESAQSDLAEPLLGYSSSVEQNAFTVLYSPHPVCIKTLGMLPEILSCKAYAIEGLAINRQDPNSKQFTFCGIAPDLYFKQLNELKLKKSRDMWYGDMSKLLADQSNSEARQFCKAQILSQGTKLPDNITEAIGFANYELQYEADGPSGKKWRPLKFIFIFTHNEALEYVRSQNGLEAQGGKIKFVEFTLECDVTSNPPPPVRGDSEAPENEAPEIEAEEQGQQVGQGAYVEEIVMPHVDKTQEKVPSEAHVSKQPVAPRVEAAKVTPPSGSVKAPPSQLPRGPPVALPSSIASPSLKGPPIASSPIKPTSAQQGPPSAPLSNKAPPLIAPPIKKPLPPTSKLVKISKSDEVSIKSQGQLIFEDLQLQSDKPGVSKSLLTTVYKAYVETLCGTLHQQFEEQVRKCEEQLMRLSEESRVKDAQYAQLLEVKRMLEEKALSVIEAIHTRKRAGQQAQMQAETELKQHEQGPGSVLSESSETPNLLQPDDRPSSESPSRPNRSEQSSKAEMLSILKYEYDEEEHCLEIRNNTKAPLTNLRLYCQTIDHLSDTQEFDEFLALLPVDFNLDDYTSQTKQFTFWIVDQDRVRCSNEFLLSLEDSQDPTSTDTSEAVSAGMTVSPDYVLIEAGYDASHFLITLTNQLTKSVVGSLVADEFEGALHADAELMPNVPLPLAYEAFEGLSLLNLKFISTEGEVLGARVFQLT